MAKLPLVEPEMSDTSRLIVDFKVIPHWFALRQTESILQGTPSVWNERVNPRPVLDSDRRQEALIDKQLLRGSAKFRAHRCPIATHEGERLTQILLLQGLIPKIDKASVGSTVGPSSIRRKRKRSGSYEVINCRVPWR